MAKAKKKKKFTFKGYVNVSISESHLSACKEYLANSGAVYLDLVKYLDTGYSFKMYYEEERDCYRVTMTCMAADDGNYGYVLAAFAGDWHTALGVLLYKHVYIAREVWDSPETVSQLPFG